MATPAEYGSPVLTEEVASPHAELDAEHESPSPAGPTKAKKKKVPRPPNAFIIYRMEWHSTAVAANPGLHNNDICE